MFSLDGKVAILTGGSMGIGAAIAAGISQAGASVLMVSRNEPSPEVRARTEGRPYHWHRADLSSTAPIPGILAACLEKFGRVDILINNAGTIVRAPFLEVPEENFDVVLSTNLKVPFFLSQAVARQMVKQGGGGKIVHIGSIACDFGSVRCPSYIASKHGLAGLTKAMANELAPMGINVNTLAPGFTRTRLAEGLDEATIVKRIPAARYAEPDEMVGGVVFLASAASNYMHGHVLYVDGGFLHR
jgi:2-deoxy-D-gluconate 3-dehydrogenase